MADRVAENVLGPVEQLFATFGLVSELSRAVFGLALGFIVWYVVKPSHTVDSNGKPKIWQPLAKPGQQGTWFPWWIYPLGLAILFGMFV